MPVRPLWWQAAARLQCPGCVPGCAWHNFGLPPLAPASSPLPPCLKPSGNPLSPIQTFTHLQFLPTHASVCLLLRGLVAHATPVLSGECTRAAVLPAVLLLYLYSNTPCRSRNGNAHYQQLWRPMLPALGSVEFCVPRSTASVLSCSVLSWCFCGESFLSFFLPSVRFCFLPTYRALKQQVGTSRDYRHCKAPSVSLGVKKEAVVQRMHGSI